MNDTFDEIKGRSMEAVGSLTENDDLKREGKVARAVATTKEMVGNAVDAVRDKVEDVVQCDR